MGDVIEILTTATNTVEVEAQGPQGIPGVGVPTGGSALQVLRKKTSTDYDTEWAAAGSGSGSVTSVALASTDLTISGSPITESGTITANIAANAVTLEKLQTISSEHLLGRHGSGNGGVQQIGLGTGLAISGSNVRVATTGITAGTYTKLTIDETGRATVGATATPQDIGAQSAFSTVNIDSVSNPSPYQLTANRAQSVAVRTTNDYTIRLPETGHQNGDIVDVKAESLSATKIITIERGVGPSSWTTLGTMNVQGGKLRFIANGTGRGDWEQDLYFTTDGTIGAPASHTHAASAITSGTLTHERGGLEADVSAYNGLVKISSGSTSAVTVTSAGEALLDDADAAAQRTTLGLGTAATSATGDFAAASHSHELTALAATGATNGHVLTANGSNGVTFAALPASGVTGAAASASDVLGVSGANITGVDANADRIIFFDDSAGKLTHLTVGSGLSISDTTISATASGGSKTYAVFSAYNDSMPPSSNYATLDTRNNIGVADYDDATDESLFFMGIIPEGASLGSGLKIRLHWMATTATSGSCAWDVSLERMTTDLDSDSFDTIGSAVTATSGTSGIINVTEITLTTIDSVTAGDGFRLKVTRDANKTSSPADDMSGDAELVLVEVRSAA